MRKTSMFAVAATLIVAGVGTWAASTTVNTASVAATTANGIEPLQVMMTANELPTLHYADYTFVFD
jgi:hypothetical protein